MSTERPRAYVIKVKISDRHAGTLTFTGQKTMYGGKRIEAGDRIFLFDSENEGGSGLAAHGIVTRAEAVDRTPGIERQTPLVTVAVRCVGLAVRPFGRREATSFRDWGDGQPGTEINFKLYRQATDKIVGIADETAAFLDGFFPVDESGKAGSA